jgi:TPR repeat protein
VAALFSCSAGERAFEHDSLKHGVFFHFVLKGLNGAAKDGDGDVNFSDLASYVTKKVSKTVPALIAGGMHQSPNMKADLTNVPVLLKSVAKSTPPSSSEPALLAREIQECREEMKKYSHPAGFLARNVSSRLSAWKAEAERGDPRAQWLYGCCLAGGIGVTKDQDQAHKLIRKGGDQGFDLAQHGVGIGYEFGLGVAQDAQAAVQWYRKAADQGLPTAQYNLGWCYQRGYGVNRDDHEAYQLYRKGAEQGSAQAQDFLAGCYQHAIGVTKNEPEAVKWYRKAADQGWARAQCNLGFCYQEGIGVTKNPQEAVAWYRKAADQGGASAQLYLSYCYEHGIGVAVNLPEAIRLCRIAANQTYDQGSRQGALTALKRMGAQP